jgi:manganese/zinc/iron transport system permease protein
VIPEIFTDYTLRVVALGAGLLGAVSGSLGCFAVLRKQSLLGDAISHAALPGIVLAFMITGSKATLILVLGAAVAGWVGTLFIIGIVGSSRVKDDSALGLILSVFFGLGLVLLTYVQRMPTASQAGLDRFLFGQAATLLERDIAVIAGLGGIAVAVTLLCWKEFKLLSFDREFGASLGIRMRLVDVLLTSVLVLAIVIGLQTVGVVLMSAMVVAPGAAARQWTDRTGSMVAIAAVIGAASGVSGAVISSLAARTPTGPAIVLCLSVAVVVSLLLAPNRGLVQAWARARRRNRQIRSDGVLRDLHLLARQHAGTHAHSVATLEAMRMGDGSVARTLDVLREQGLARQSGTDQWLLTERGAEEAERRFAGHEDEEGTP